MKKSFIYCFIFLFVMIATTGLEAAYLVYQHGSLPMVTQKVKVTIDNQVAVTQLEMVFYNPNDYTIQPNIKFPIHEKASVQNFSLTDSEGNVFSGAIQESGQAQKVFNEAKSEGMMPAMTVQKQPGVFEASIGAIGPRSRATVMIEYSEILGYSRGTVSYTLPFRIDNAQRANLETSAISISIVDQKEISSVVSPSHDIYAEKIAASQWNIVFEKNNYLPTDDFRLNYNVKAEALATNFLTTRPEAGEDGYFMLMLSPAEIISAEDIANRDIVFVMDTSGSMSGRKIDQTKRAFDFFVQRLNENDRFGIVAFSSQVQAWMPELLPVSEENRKVASEYISKLRAGGGTNINDSLQTALKLFDQAQGRTRTLVFLTDGEASAGVTDTRSIVENAITTNQMQTRIFTLGVGSNVNTMLLNKLAVENRGEALYLNDQTSDIDQQLMTFYENISTPLLVDLALNWSDAEVSEVYPRTLPNIYQGTQLVVTGRYKKGTTANITLTGNLNQVKQTFKVEAPFAEQSDKNLFVSRFWAKAKADDLILQMNTYGQKQELKDEVIALSKKFQFTTPFTSFIAVSTTPVPQVTKRAANHVSARNTSAMARPERVRSPRVSTTATAQAPTRTVIRRTEAKSLSLWGASGFLPIAAIAVPNFRKAREQARGKACLANQRVLMGAIEMYNMDHPNNPITELDEHVMEDLIQGKYLKAPIVMAEQSCCFASVGQLDQDGFIICAEHGSPEHPFDATTSEEVKNQARKGLFINFENGNTKEVIEVKYEPESWFTRIWNSWLADLVSLLINVPLFIVGIAFTLYFTYAIIMLPFKIIGGIIEFFSGKES